MKNQPFSFLPILALAFILQACGDSGLGTVNAGGSLVVKAFSGTKDLNGTNWLEPCTDYGGGEYRINTMTLGATGSRTETTYSDTGCTTGAVSNTFALVISNDGDQIGMTFSDGLGNFNATGPGSLGTTEDATRATISGNDGSGPFSFKTTLYYYDEINPALLLFGDDETIGAPIDGAGYPTSMWQGGAEEQ